MKKRLLFQISPPGWQTCGRETAQTGLPEGLLLQLFCEFFQSMLNLIIINMDDEQLFSILLQYIFFSFWKSALCQLLKVWQLSMPEFLTLVKNSKLFQQLIDKYIWINYFCPLFLINFFQWLWQGSEKVQ